MALDELVATIEKLKSRISDHRASISSSETRTRQVLIDPLLMVLGWDVTDPTQVTLEYSAGQGRADYALLGAQGTVAVVEAKRLGENLQDNHVMQVLNYANSQGIAHMVLSNGDEWRMYDVFRRAKLSERLMMELKISTTPVHETALNSLSLWRANLGPGAKPIVVNINDTDQNPELLMKDIDEPNAHWIPISDQSLSVAGTKIMAIKIQGVVQSKTNESLGDNGTRTRWSWPDFIPLIATWLVDKGKLKPDDCPVFATRSTTRCLINDKPTHPDGKRFTAPRELPHGMWFDNNFNHNHRLQMLRQLLEKSDVNPNVVEIKVEKRNQ